MIIEQYNPKRVWQWGSVIHRSRFSSRSDIDIAIEGLADAHAIFEIYEKAEKLTDFTLDIVEMEKIEPEFAELIRKRGVLVYGRS